MYLLYLDESGNENDPNDRYFVLGGMALFERQTFFLTQDIEAIQDKHFPNHALVPFHASEIRGRPQPVAPCREGEVSAGARRSHWCGPQHVAACYLRRRSKRAAMSTARRPWRARPRRSAGASRSIAATSMSARQRSAARSDRFLGRSLRRSCHTGRTAVGFMRP